nr:heterodisulfide reductase-related iron-sulfur binding cluster [Candidatus Baldrarchaeota archaeon]
MSSKMYELFKKTLEKYLPGKGVTKRITPDQLELKRFEDLEHYKDVLYFCGKCGQCRYVFQEAYWSRVCPSGELKKFEAYYLGGKNLLLWGVLSGKLKWTENLAKILYHCTLCGNCTQQCQIPEIHHYALEWLFAARIESVKRGIAPMPEHRKFGEWTKKEHNPYMELHTDRQKWISSDIRRELPEKADIVYFVGCTSSYREIQVAKAMLDILTSLKLNFTILKDEWCCGSPLFWTGQIDIAKECAKHNIEEIEKSGATIVVTSCAGCYRMIKEIYRNKFGLEYSFEVLHAPEFLLSLVKDGTLPLENEISEKVTYHDPCHIGRHMGLYEPPRELLKNIPGIELIEMTRNRRNAWCCGAGAGVKSAFKDLALFAAHERLKEAQSTEAEILATSCPFCERNLRDAAKAYNVNIKVVDIIELIKYSM